MLGQALYVLIRLKGKDHTAFTAYLQFGCCVVGVHYEEARKPILSVNLCPFYS